MVRTILLTLAVGAMSTVTMSTVTMSTAAFAADLPARRFAPELPPAVPAFSWAGFYIGGQVGYGFGQEDGSVAVPGAAGVTFGSSPRGVLGGAHVGYNASTQSLLFLSGVFGAGGVIGLEGDVDVSGARRTHALGGNAGFFPAGGTESVRTPVEGSIRARLGFAVDRALFYATGGAAFADIRNGFASNAAFGPAGGGYDTISRTRVGYTVGGGVEYAFTDALSLRAEYRYSDFGRDSAVLLNSATVPGTTVARREVENRVQGGFSYKFETALPPVVARY